MRSNRAKDRAGAGPQDVYAVRLIDRRSGLPMRQRCAGDDLHVIPASGRSGGAGRPEASGLGGPDRAPGHRPDAARPNSLRPATAPRQHA